MKPWLIGILAVAVAAAGVSRFRSVRTELVEQREAIGDEWPELSSAFDARAELIAQMVDAVKGFETNQAAVFGEVERARAALGNGGGPEKTIAANEKLTGALARLLVASENYRELRADRSFQRLQEELAAADSQIAIERRKYNELLEHYNAQIQKFPYNVVAGISGFQRNDAYFKTAPGALEGAQ